MRISYHTYEDYIECPYRFKLKHIDRVPPTVPVDEYHTMYGRLIGKFFEMYSNVWRFKTPYLFPEHIRERMNILFDGLIATHTINWRRGTRNKEEIIDQACTDAHTIMESPSLNYFLNSKSEVSMEVKLQSGHKITGRPDFIHQDAKSGTPLILDGKGSKKKGKYISDEQLYYYALLYYLTYNEIPQLGFFYYRYNEFIPIDFTENDLKDFRAKVSLSIKGMFGGEYPATAKNKVCQYCDYNNSCADWAEAKAARARGSKLDMVGDGVIEFGL